MKNHLEQLIRAGFPGLYILSPEELRVESLLAEIAKAVSRRLFSWTATTGLLNLATQESKGCTDPLELLTTIEQETENGIFVLKDFHLFWDSVNPIELRKFKEVLRVAKNRQQTLIVIGARKVMPPDLEREMTLVPFQLPKPEELASELDGIARSANLPVPEGEERIRLLEAAAGLTTNEAENAFALSYIQTKKLDARVIARHKAETLKKNGLLELTETGASLDDIGGLQQLKSWLSQRNRAFSPEARAFGLPAPKGILILGIPGTGKSLTAKATSNILNVPLLRFDVGRVFGSLVGQSEEQIRTVIQTAETIAPCILWVDEIEKGFSGTRGSSSTDGGTSSRVFGTFLSWLQDKTSPVFVVATANDITQLPPELLRKGRFDELFFVDLPNEEERHAIWEIQIDKHGRKPTDFDLAELAAVSKDMTGAEIEQAFIEALYSAFHTKQTPNTDHIRAAIRSSRPLAQTMANDIKGLRDWASSRTRLANLPAHHPPREATRQLAA